MTKELLEEKFNHILDSNLVKEIFKTGTFRQFKKDYIIIDINLFLQYTPLLLSEHIKILREDSNGNERPFTKTLNQ